MKCTLCGCAFDEKQAEKACKNCPVMKGCRLIRCPNCGFETPPAPGWLKYFKEAMKANIKLPKWYLATIKQDQKNCCPKLFGVILK